jgi:outer membrane biosynthesis protein TonB
MINSDVRFSELLKKWLQGDFGNKDEKELHSMLKNDDFQREAMEGYQVMPEANHEAKLLDLKHRLEQKTKQHPATVMSLQRMLAAAAIFALLIAAFWFIPRNLEQKQAEVAQNLPETKVQETTLEPTIEEKTDQILSKSSKKASKKPVIVQDKNTSTVSINPSGANITASQDDAIKVEKTPEKPSEVQADYAILEENAKATEAITSAPIATTAPKPIEKDYTDKELTKSRAKKQETRPISPAKSEAKAKHNTDSKPNMEALKGKTDELPVNSEPAGGWDAFQEYCRLNAHLTDLARNNNVSGVVRLQFSIDNNGDPINFLTVKSLGYGCDEEAIRLVKDFEWIKGKSGLVNVEIKFTR